MTKQGDNNDKEGTTERANKNLPKHDLSNGIRQNKRETQNIQKSIVKKKRGRQCLRWHEDNAKKRESRVKWRKHIRETKHESKESIKT